MNESERPSVEGLMCSTADLLDRVHFRVHDMPLIKQCWARAAELRAYAEHQTLSAQPVASKELSDEQINDLAGKAGLPMSWLRDGKAAAWPELRRFANSVLAADRPPSDADRKLIRAQALEEAAKKCDAAAKAVRETALAPKHVQHAQIAIAMAQIPEECAAAIRALALPSVPGEKP